MWAVCLEVFQQEKQKEEAADQPSHFNPFKNISRLREVHVWWALVFCIPNSFRMLTKAVLFFSKRQQLQSTRHRNVLRTFVGIVSEFPTRMEPVFVNKPIVDKTDSGRGEQGLKNNMAWLTHLQMINSRKRRSYRLDEASEWRGPRDLEPVSVRYPPVDQKVQ